MRKGESNRVIAFLLAMLMVVSTMGSSSMTAYAQGTTTDVEIVTEESTTEEISTEEGTTEESSIEFIEEVVTEVASTEEEVNAEESASVEENVEVSLEDEVFVAEEDSVSENEPAYTGDTGDDILYIYQYKMEEANVEYTDENLIAIATYWKNAGRTFTDITIDYPVYQESISKEVWNAFAELQIGENNNFSLSYALGLGNYVNEWVFRNISSAENDITLAVDWKGKESGEGVEISFQNTSIPAEGSKVGLKAVIGDERFSEMYNAFSKEGNTTVIYDAEGKQLYNIEFHTYCLDYLCEIHIYGVEDLEANTTYTVNHKKYTGTLQESSNGSLGLSFIDGYWETEEELVEMIQANKDKGVNEIYFYDTVSGNSVTVPTSVVNAAIGILTPAPEDAPRIYFNSRGYGLDVEIIDPHSPIDTAVEGENLTFSMDISVSGEEVKVKKNAPVIDAFDVRLSQNFTEEEDGVADPFTELYPMDSLEDGRKEFFVESKYISARYIIDEHECTFSLVENVKLLENDTWYTLTENVSENPAGVPGTITVDSDGFRRLTLVADQVNKDVFARGELAEALSWYSEKIVSGEIEPFHYISIYQDNSEKNIIYKEDFNFLRKLLISYDSSSKCIDYFFERDTQVSGNAVADNEQWCFSSPAPATEDMDVTNVSIKTMKNGIKIKFPKIAYPSDFVDYSRSMDSRLEEAKNLYASFHNQPESSSSGFMLYEDAETMKEVYRSVGLFWDWEYNGKKECAVHIGWVNELGTDEYTLVKNLEDEPLYIGEPRQLTTNFTPDKGSKINYKCGTNRITINDKGVLTPVSEGAARYAISYLLDGEWTVDFWHSTVSKKILSMKFSNASMANPLEAELGTAEKTKLELTYYPIGTAPKADELKWSVESVSENSVSNNSVSANCVELVLDKEGNPTGELKLVEPGEAIVTVTLKDNPNVCAKAKVVVKPNLDEEESTRRETLEEQGIYAISNLDKTLKDVKLPEDLGYRWADEDIALVRCDIGGLAEYPAIYKSPIDGREKNVLLPVDVRTFILGTELALNDEPVFTDKIIMDHGDVLYMDAWGEDWATGKGGYLLEQLLEARNLDFESVLTSNPEDIVQESDSDNYQWMFTADSAKSGKKNFTVELFVVHNDTGEKVSIEKKKYTVTVAKKPIMNWDDDFEVVKATDGDANEIEEDSPKGELGEFVFMQPKEGAFNLTVKSLDPKVCKIIKQQSPQVDGDQMVTRVTYECLAGGIAQISVTAKDEMKSNKVYQFDVIDVMPRALESTVTIDINRKEDKQTDSLKWLLNSGTTILDEEEELLLGDINIDNIAGDDVKLHLVNEKSIEGTVELCAELINPSIKKGKYKVDVTAPVMYGEDQHANFTTTVTINITDVKPKVTLKQTKKVNLFYTDEQSYGEFTLKPSLGSITDVQLLPPNNKTCDYVIEETDKPDTYIVKLDEEATKDTNKSGVLKVTLDEYRDPVDVKFSIKTENKKPTLVLSQKTDTLYPIYTANVTSVLQFTDKATGNVVNNISAVEYKSGKDFVALEEEGSLVKGNKNTYKVSADTDKITFVLEEDSRQKTTDKFSLKIKGDNWKTSLPVSYSIKVEITNPKLALSTKTINFNMNEKLYRNEVAYVDLAFKGVAGKMEDIGNVLIEAYPGESQTAFNKWISAKYVDGRVRVALEDIEGLTKSSYTWKFYITAYGAETGYYVWDTLKVKLTNTAPEKCISASAKGSIDVLDRTKGITYTPKLKNVQGTVVGGRLTGKDSEMFTTVFEDGVLKVSAKPGVRYNTKTKYSVVPEFTVKNADEKTVKLALGKEQTIKVKQGKAKLKADKVTWYRDRQIFIDIPVSAILNGKEVSIVEMELTNFTNDLDAYYDGENKCITMRLLDNKVNEMNATGKTYNLKFNVYYWDGAVNEKPATFTVKVDVR